MTSTLLLGLVLATATPQAVREQRAIGISLAPALVFHHVGGVGADALGSDGFIMPLGMAVDVVLAGRWAASLAVARFPAPYEPKTHLYAGARRYLLARPLSPYLATDVGLEWNKLESGEVRRSPFLTAGAGLEWAMAGGPVLSADLHLGPQHADIGAAQHDWQLLARARVLVGYRLP